MKNIEWVWVGYSCAWIATGLCVVIAIYTLKTAAPLWALLIPGCISITRGKSDE
jgi:hypothetical protein